MEQPKTAPARTASPPPSPAQPAAPSLARRAGKGPRPTTRAPAQETTPPHRPPAPPPGAPPPPRRPRPGLRRPAWPAVPGRDRAPRPAPRSRRPPRHPAPRPLRAPRRVGLRSDLSQHAQVIPPKEYSRPGRLAAAPAARFGCSLAGGRGASARTCNSRATIGSRRAQQCRTPQATNPSKRASGARADRPGARRTAESGAYATLRAPHYRELPQPRRAPGGKPPAGRTARGPPNIDRGAAPAARQRRIVLPTSRHQGARKPRRRALRDTAGDPSLGAPRSRGSTVLGSTASGRLRIAACCAAPFGCHRARPRRPTPAHRHDAPILPPPRAGPPWAARESIPGPTPQTHHETNNPCNNPRCAPTGSATRQPATGTNGHRIPYHTIPYHTIPYHTIPYHTIPYHTIPYHTIPYHTIPYH